MNLDNDLTPPAEFAPCTPDPEYPAGGAAPITREELFTALTGEPASVGDYVPDGTEKYTAQPVETAAEKRTRNTGRRIWQKKHDMQPTACWLDIDSPPLADLAAANKWLEAELTAGRLTGGVYRPASVQDETEAVVETVTSVRLT